VALATSAAIVLAAALRAPLPVAYRSQSQAREQATGLAVPAGTTASTPVSAAVQESSAQDREQLGKQMEQKFRAMEAFASAVPADTFDPQAVLAKVGWS
jgi:hypothetical protein